MREDRRRCFRNLRKKDRTTHTELTLLPDLYVAWHAGVSFWQNYNSLNKYSIGIEISNPGHDYKYLKFNNKQIRS